MNSGCLEIAEGSEFSELSELSEFSFPHGLPPHKGGGLGRGSAISSFLLHVVLRSVCIRVVE